MRATLEVSVPWTCYSYPPAVPPDAGNGSVSDRSRSGPRQMPASCYNYPLICFSYLDNVPSASGTRDATPASPPGLRQMPITCFRY